MSDEASNNSKLPRPLSAKYKEDFAYKTVKDRMPVILTRVIDTVFRLKNDVSRLHGQEGLDDLKLIVGGLSQLKNYLQTDKPLTPFSDNLSDVSHWNRYLEEDQERMKASSGAEEEPQGGKNRGVPSWFSSAWLFVECYMYRGIASAISQCRKLKDFDPFRGQKQEALLCSAAAVTALTDYVHSCLSSSSSSSSERLFHQLIHVALWGNKCDLSISGGAENHQTVNVLAQLEHLAPNVLHDDTALIWKHLLAMSDVKAEHTTRQRRVDIVLDNAGFELVTDLCLAELLIAQNLADIVYFHAKAIPWFVSDVTLDDWNWTLRRLSVSTMANSSDDQTEVTLGTTSELSRGASVDDPESCGSRWRALVNSGKFVILTNNFWTLPHDFSAMSSIAPTLYSDLSRSDLILFKGDLNYRKLIGDLHWEATASFVRALRGFSPAPLAALRTLKCDVVVGLIPGKAEIAAKADPDWMINGSYGVIQFYNPSQTEMK